MPLTIFFGPHPHGGLRTVACPTWDDGTPGCHCPKMPDGSVPRHQELHWPNDQDPNVSVKEAMRLAEHHFGRTRNTPHGDLKGLQEQA